MTEESQKNREIMRSFRKVNSAIYHLLRRVSDYEGITPIQFFVIQSLHREPNISLTDVADRINLGASASSGVIDRLVKAGLVYRERSESDRRTLTLGLTDRGEQMYQATKSKLDSLLSSVMIIGEEDAAHLLRIHEQIIESLDRARREIND